MRKLLIALLLSVGILFTPSLALSAEAAPAAQCSGLTGDAFYSCLEREREQRRADLEREDRERREREQRDRDRERREREEREHRERQNRSPDRPRRF